MNYTKPNLDNYDDKPEDWLLAALLYCKTLGLVIPEGSGVVVDLVGDMIDLYPDTKRVIVHNNGKNIAVVKPVADEIDHLKEGTWVRMVNKEDIMN